MALTSPTYFYTVLPVLSLIPIPCCLILTTVVVEDANSNLGFNSGKDGSDLSESTRSCHLYTILYLSLHLLSTASATPLFQLRSMHQHIHL
jgi:hypothetical protein